MMIRLFKNSPVCLLVLLLSATVSAQDNRTQLPGILTNNTYFDANVGFINYNFTNKHLAPGFTAGSVRVPHAGVRLILYGYKLNKYLSVQVTYLRPVLWMQFQNINGDKGNHSVVMNITGITFKGTIPFKKKLAMYVEAGLADVSRTGFKINDVPVVKNASFPTIQAGAGLTYKLNDHFSLTSYAGWSPSDSKNMQPATVFFSAGARYSVKRFSPERVAANRNSGYIFPANLLQVGYTSKVLNYGVNDFFSNKYFPIFWGGDVQVRSGVTVSYQRNVYHGRKTFSIDVGVSSSYWTSNLLKQHFYTVSIFPLFRFTLIHSKMTDIYFAYSVAGPSYISKFRIDETETGKHFTFQDNMGIGIYSGKHRNINAEIKIGHYSNGDLFPQNNGVMTPLTFNLGYAF